MNLHEILSEAPRQNSPDVVAAQANNKMYAEAHSWLRNSPDSDGKSSGGTFSKWLPYLAIGAVEVGAGVAGALVVGPLEGVVAGTLVGMWVATPFIPVDAMAAKFIQHEVQDLAKRL